MNPGASRRTCCGELPFETSLPELPLLSPFEPPPSPPDGWGDFPFETVIARIRSAARRDPRFERFDREADFPMHYLPHLV
jgi:hypothetical protein